MFIWYYKVSHHPHYRFAIVTYDAINPGARCNESCFMIPPTTWECD